MNRKKIPLWFKITFSALFAVTVISNIINYSFIDLLWFCDVSIILAFFGLWFESSLLLSMAALSAVGPQLVWQLDYFFQMITGKSLFGFTDYMFAPDYPVYNYIVSLFHLWMPFMLLYTLWVVRYSSKALPVQTLTGSAIILLSYLITDDMFSPAGNLNKVYGPIDSAPQTWMHPWLWVAVVMVFCVLCIYLPTHFVFTRLFKKQSVVSNA